MEFSIKGGNPERISAGCIVLGVFEPRRLSPGTAAMDRVSGGHIRSVLKRGDMDGKAGHTQLLYGVPKVVAERILLVGLGPEKEFGERQFRDATRCAINALKNSGARDAVFCLPEPMPARTQEWLGKQAFLIAADAEYRFDAMKSKRNSRLGGVRRMTFLANDDGKASAVQSALREASAIAQGVKLAKDLGNLPSNVCNPSYLADVARDIGKEHKVDVVVVGRKQLQRLGMNTLLSVAKGSAEPCKFIELNYRGGNKSARPVVLVGKGVTFDTGGISIKPALEMDEMKFDMCGAASVLGTIKAAALLRLPINVVGLIPAVENMPGGRASKPGDIVTSMSGQTVEILNTDAEGRLILCDALTYAERFQPQAVIDIATLTGACVIALGHVVSGLFANDDGLADELIAAGRQAHDRAWRLPLWDEYQEQLKSNFADFANIGGRPAGSVTAACFLSRFAGKFKWAHLDIAGTAWKSGKEKGSTGRPVPLLTEFLIGRAHSS